MQVKISKLIRIDDGAVIEVFDTGVPNLLKLPNGDAVQPGGVGTFGDYAVIEGTSEKLETFTPARIVAALEEMGVAGIILENTDELTKAKFYTATTIHEDNPLLVGALKAVGKTIEDLKEILAKV